MKRNQKELFIELINPVLKQIKRPELLYRLRMVVRIMQKRPRLLEELDAILKVVEERPFLLMEEGRELWTRGEAADYFQVIFQTLHNWKKNKILVPVKIGAKVYYPKSEIDNLVSKKGGSDGL